MIEVYIKCYSIESHLSLPLLKKFYCFKPVKNDFIRDLTGGADETGQWGSNHDQTVIMYENVMIGPARWFKCKATHQANLVPEFSPENSHKEPSPMVHICKPCAPR